MGYKLGFQCKLYRCATLLSALNTPDVADWKEISNVRDLTLNLEKGEADVTTRANSGWRASAATLKDGTVEFEALWDPDDDGFGELLAAWQGGDEIALAVMDGDMDAGPAEGLAANFNVMDLSRSEAIEGGVMAAVSVKPASFAQWYEVAAS